MTSRESLHRACELTALIARACPDQPAHLIATRVAHLQRIARQAKAICERQCNGYHHEEDETRDNKRIDGLRRRAQALAADFCTSATVRLGGDPRGPCCRIKIPGQPGDGWDRGAGEYVVY